jgi:hypothetical protein
MVALRHLVPRAKGGIYPRTPGAKFPAPSIKFPARTKKFPAPLSREFAHNRLMLFAFLMRESPFEAIFSKNSLLNSLLAGNLRVETGSIRAAATTTQSCANWIFPVVGEQSLFSAQMRGCDEGFAVSVTRKRGSEVISGLLSLGPTNLFPAAAN